MPNQERIEQLEAYKLKERFIWEPRNENENDLFKLGMIDYLRKHKI